MPNVLNYSNLKFLFDSKAISMFENDERFKAVERGRDREDLFESYIVELERKVMMFSFIENLINSNIYI